MKIADLWIVTTSNNLGGVDGDTELYLTREQAEAAAALFNQTGIHGRKDWLAENLSDAIGETVSAACANATDEG